jgi:histidinol-phosphate/aromatic aminotransferase/cobyric acid decarboxylase-like protein
VVAAAGRLHRYPRGLMEAVTALVADHLRVSPRQVLLTAGVDEAVDIALRLAERGWAVDPGFDGYPDRVTANGKPFHAIPLGPDWQPARGAEDLGVGDMVFLAQPGNPTGNLFDPAWIHEVRQAAQYVLFDETYQDFSSRPGVLEHGIDSDRLLVYRSFSKGMGLAGIRVGALVADAAVIARLEPARRFMPIDAVSLNAAAGAIEDPDYVKRLISHVLEARAALTALLRGCGLFAEVRDTETNFVLARPAAGAADRILGALARERIRIKTCDLLGLPGWFRISVGTWDDQERLADCLGRLSRTPSIEPR